MLQTFDPPAVPLYATEKSIPLLLILPTFCTAGSAAPAVAGGRGSNNMLSVTRLYTSTVRIPPACQDPRATPTLVDLFSSHLISGFPNAICRKPGWMLVCDPPMS